MRARYRIGVLAAASALVAAVPSLVGASTTAKPPSASFPSVGGPQHWCGSNGITCAEPASNWDEYAGYDKAIANGAKILPYIGHDEPATLFYSNRPGSGNDVHYNMVLPTDPPTQPKQKGNGGTWSFQLHPTFWLGMVFCDNEGSPNPDGAALTGHPTVPCNPDSDSNIYASENPNSPRYFGLGPGQAYMEMQFYPPGWAPWPAGISCTATQWCAALNIDTFQDNENTGDFNNTACLNTVGPEPVNFAFLTKNGNATAPGNPLSPNRFVPVPSKDFLMGSGDQLSIQMNDTSAGFKVVINDLTTGKTGSMTASVANGFGSPLFQPTSTTCNLDIHAFHPMYSTSTPQTRNVNAAHTYNVAFSDEIGHFEYCGKVGTDPFSTCLRSLGPDTNNPDNAGPDPEGDDDFCLPASASLLIQIGGCLDTDGDFDGVAYGNNWPGSLSNKTADALLNPTSFLFTSPTTDGANFSSMAFEADISRNESDDTAFRVDQFCQRHITNPADPNPGKGCVNPPPNSVFYPFYSTTQKQGSCWWQEGGRFIPGTTNNFGASSKAEYGPLVVVSYPTAPLGTITTRYNDFRQSMSSNPCMNTLG